MKKQQLSTRFAVVQRLQEKLASLQPGSPKFELYDKAYELALSSKRAEDNFFMRNVLRDAKIILKRKPKVKLISLNADTPFIVESLKYDRALSYNSGPENLETQTLLNTITFICEHVHKNAGAILTCMLDGYDINDTVERTKLSQSLVKKIRVNIKKEVKLKFSN
jgi:hypothetical protein